MLKLLGGNSKRLLIKVFDIEEVEQSQGQLDWLRSTIENGKEQEKDPSSIFADAFVALGAILESVKKRHVLVVVIAEEDRVVHAMAQLRREPNNEEKAEQLERAW